MEYLSDFKEIYNRMKDKGEVLEAEVLGEEKNYKVFFDDYELIKKNNADVSRVDTIKLMIKGKHRKIVSDVVKVDNIIRVKVK